MKSRFEFNGIDWEGQGYFGCPSPPPHAKLANALRNDPWLAWIIIFDQAKKGDFSSVSKLLNLYWEEKNHVLRRSCMVLMGDAGPSSSLSHVEQFLRAPSGPIYSNVARHFCGALAERGRLADIPLLLDIYLQNAGIDEADIIPVYISELMESGTGNLSEPREFTSLHDYAEAVKVRHHELVKHFGTEDVYVFGGEHFGVIRLARMLLKALREPWFPMVLRARFEASTGIDCSRFYKNGVLQPLTAAALVEEFLESPQADRYAEGVRYFFGHRIPD